MKANSLFLLRKIGEIYLIVPLQKKEFSPQEILTTNETGAFLWNLLQKECTKKELVSAMESYYSIDPDTALKDIDQYLQQLDAIGALS